MSGGGSVTKKLIEVALPLEAINKASVREGYIYRGNPSALHKWWAQRPLAAARAVIFAQMVDDPSSHPDIFRTEKAQEKERQRLFRIIEDLVLWENTTNETVLQAARDEIWQSWRYTCAENADHPGAKALFDRHKLPAFHDPFAGGGTLPLEAQRLGLESYASDLNPVAVLINKAMIEIPPKFAGKPPVNPEARAEIARSGGWHGTGAQGLATDVRYYGQWMRDEAEKRIGHLYPKVEVTADMAIERPDLKPYVGKSLTVIAWLWARTVKSPNPAFAHVDVPLASTFMLSTKAGKEAYVEPVILPAPQNHAARHPGDNGLPAEASAKDGGYRFTVKVGKPENAEAAKNGTKLARANFLCLMSGAPMSGDYIKAEGKAGRMGARLMAIVAEGERGRVYLAPTPEHEAAAGEAKPEWKPDVEFFQQALGFRVGNYGMTKWSDLFADRQLVALTTFSDLVQEARERAKRDILGARASGPPSPPGARASGPPSPPPAGWHSRGYHPHFDHPGLLQSITFRLHDSVPDPLLQQWRDELGMMLASSDDERLAKLRDRIDKYEDAGHGACHLREPRIAALVEEAFMHFDGERYRLLEWCVIPNHVHVLVETLPGHSLRDVIQSWKSFTAKEANRLVGRSGKFWMADYFDRFIRDERHLGAVRGYIRENPVKALLCDGVAEWRFGSAWGGERAGGPRTQEDDKSLRDGGAGATAYAEAVAVYLAFSMSKAADYNCALVPWYTKEDRPGHLFSKQAIPMVWDYAELNPFSPIGGGVTTSVEIVSGALDGCHGKGVPGHVSQVDAVTVSRPTPSVISTDPPYYDNIAYADLSDFFYVWLRRSLKSIFPDLFATVAVPKAEELVATPYRHGNKEKAEAFFLDGMTRAMRRLSKQAHPAFPVTIYYAFKQSESDGAEATASTGWETFLDAVIRAGFAISGTWPMRTERNARSRGIGSNALASSIILVCRKRAADAPTATRRAFVNALKVELPAAVRMLQGLPSAPRPLAPGISHPPPGTFSLFPIAPVDLAQAAIGPGMAVYTRYAKVLDAEGKALTVRDALTLINQTLDEALAEQEGDFDADSRWALTWFEQAGFAEGEYGVAEQLSKSKNTSVSGMVAAGVVASKSGKVRLLKPSELPDDWDPVTDTRLTAWETVHHLIRALEAGGEGAAATLVTKLGSNAEVARELCYRLYTICERKKRAPEALAYNGLVQSWPEITRLASEAARPGIDQPGLFG